MGNSDSSDYIFDDEYECAKCGKEFSKWIAWRTHQTLCRKKPYDVDHDVDDGDDDIFVDNPPHYRNIEHQDEAPRIRAHTFQGLQRLNSYLENMPVQHPLHVPTREPFVGTRVVRGPTWKYQDEDSGEGGVGTVTGPGDFGYPKRVEVTWDNGKVNSYNTGRYGLFDLLVLDTSGTDCVHGRIYCNVCSPPPISEKDVPIRGMRWQCLDCFDYDLCTHCYMNGEHDLTHKFLRHEFPNTDGEPVASRSDSRKVQKRGLYPSAKVVLRQNDRQAEDKEGTIICDEYLSPGVRESVQVEWDDGTLSPHKVGLGGDVDLKCVTSAEEGYYYPGHLPMCGDVARSSSVDSEQNSPFPSEHFEVGDVVMISLPEDILQATMDKYGEWDVEIAQLMDKPGIVRRISGSKFVLVEYDLEEMGLYMRQRIQSFHPLVIGKLGGSNEQQDVEEWTFVGEEEEAAKVEEQKEEQPEAQESDVVEEHKSEKADEEEPEAASSSSYVDDMCHLCEEMKAIITFRPCGHQITCQSCSVRIKKCFECRLAIEEKTLPGEEENQKLQEKLEEMHLSQQCTICFDRKKDTAFPCGHGACRECSKRMRFCHECRLAITRRIQLFL